jgi:hypothetical protein
MIKYANTRSYKIPQKIVVFLGYLKHHYKIYVEIRFRVKDAMQNIYSDIYFQGQIATDEPTFSETSYLLKFSNSKIIVVILTTIAST